MGKSQGIRAFLGLGPGRAQPDGRPGAVRHCKIGNPTKTKGKRALNGTANQRGRKSSSLQAPSRDPRGHIQHWLIRKSVGDAATPDGTRGSPGEPHGWAPEACQFESGYKPRMQPASWRSPGIPGSSTDPTPGGRRPGAGGFFFFAPGDQDASHRGPQGARRADPEGSRGSREHQSDRGWSPPREAGFGLEVGAMSDGEGTPPRVRFIPDLFVPFPGGGWATGPSPAWQEGYGAAGA